MKTLQITKETTHTHTHTSHYIHTYMLLAYV